MDVTDNMEQGKSFERGWDLLESWNPRGGR